MTVRRAVSLVPSVTETLLALGCTPVACTRFCEQPAIPAVGGTKDPDVAAIVALAPDVVVMNDEENRREDFDALRAAGITVLDVSPRSVVDVGDAVCRLAEVASVLVPAPFADWSAWLVDHGAATTPRTAVTMVWRRPWMALGRDTYGASVLAGLGFDTPAAAGADGARYPEVTLEQVRALDPDVVVLPSEPYPFAERHRVEVAEAVPGAAVELVDGQDLLWWGIRTPHALMRLASRLG
ncbi:MAG: helical backbone metal receptor [Acidimicrobiia bacterium]|jgi:ABC-type Fe3+-hydroxamate transport system substrate-binding protein